MKKKAVDDERMLKQKKDRLAVWTGVIVGLVFSLVLWGNEGLNLRAAHALFPFAKLAMGVLPATGLCTLTAWYANRRGKTSLTLLLWLITGGLLALFAGHLPFEGMTLFYRVFDPQTALRVAFPFNAAISTRVLSLVVICAVLAGVSGTFFGRMLVNAANNTSRAGAFVTMLVWSIFFFGSAWIIFQTLEMPFVRPVEVINNLVEAKISDESSALSAEQAASVNLPAIEPAAPLLFLPRRLVLSGYDDLVNQTHVQVDFGGQWVDCTVEVDRSSGSPVLKAGVCQLAP